MSATNIARVPFNDLKLQYRSIKEEIDTAIQSVIEETAFVRGKYVKQFETQFARQNGVKHCISCANGTDAIFLVLKALGIGPGDEVITTACSWISTSETITLAGARVIFVDIEPDYYTIDVSKVEEKITRRTKAVIPVHLYGQPADMEPLKALCDRCGLFLVEDCAQAHFARYKGQLVGTIGNAGTFSFYPGKNLGAYGDAGAVITNDDQLAERVRMIANHGSLVKHQHRMEGINSRMDGLQAAVLSVKLKYIQQWNEARHRHGLMYNRLLKEVEGVTVSALRPGSGHTFHLYVIRLSQRDALKEYLDHQGIATGIHYPTPLPFLQAYRYLEAKPEDFPVALDYQKQILSLPMFPELTGEEIERVVDAVREYAG
jgi:dTDP-4-amino-4,6-dideoxygalactose transaminase